MLFEPFALGGLVLKNRIVMPPMGTRMASEVVSQTLKDYHQARAMGGVGMIIVEATCVDSPIGRRASNELLLHDDRFIPGLSELASVIKSHGARAAIQLTHAGANTSSKVTGCLPVGPSQICMPGRDVSRQLETSEIPQVVSRFADAAARAKAAGFEGVEIHAAHRYLLAQFLSAAWNKRQDSYGGSVENRARILQEIIATTKSAVGPAFPVWCRINAFEYEPRDGITLEESTKIALMAREAGASAIHVSAYGTAQMMIALPDTPGALLPLAREIKRAVAPTPVIAVGRLDPKLAESVLEDGIADLVCFGRGLIVDPNLPLKAGRGELRNIAPCISCHGCASGVRVNEPITCSVNPVLGREGEGLMQPAKDRKRVLVVGGGPAGMKAAETAAIRGRDVTLIEREARLGGQLVLAAKPSYKKQRIDSLTHYLGSRLDEHKVEVLLNVDATPEYLAKGKFDSVILATGASPSRPQIRGMESADVVQAWDVLTGKATTGKRVIVVGGGRTACETAFFLAERRKNVTVVECRKVLEDVSPFVREDMLQRLSRINVKIWQGVRDEWLEPRRMSFVTEDGYPESIETDSVVLATGVSPRRELASLCKSIPVNSFVAGDCATPGSISSAIRDGFEAGRKC